MMQSSPLCVLESKSRQTLAQIVGGAALLVGLYFTAQTLRTIQEGQLNERFTNSKSTPYAHNACKISM